MHWGMVPSLRCGSSEEVGEDGVQRRDESGAGMSWRDNVAGSFSQAHFCHGLVSGCNPAGFQN